MTAKRLLTGILSVLVVAAVMAPSLMAQSLVSGDVTGTVTDPSGAVLSGASVMLKSDATGQTRTSTTGSNGNYRFSLLPPGNYTITVTMSGFSKAEEKAAVNVGQATVSDVKMSVGTSSQTVEVQATAPLVQADNADLSTNFSQTLIANAPNGGNDITYIAQTSPGAVMNTASGYGNFSVYGLPSTANLFAVNGENDMDPYLNVNNSGATNLTLGRNDLQEVTVISNAYSGQYGQQAGAQVNYVTKSGTNQLHGDAIYYWNGSSMNANGWLNDQAGVPKPFANNNQWALGLGGPIKKDKLFYYLNTEGIRFVLPASGPVFLWSPQFTAASEAYIAANAPNELGLYSRYYNLVNSFTSTHSPTMVDGGCDAAMVGFTGNCINQYQANSGQNGSEFIASGRLDYNLSDKDHLFWRVRVDQGVQPTAVNFINPAFAANSYQPAYDGQGQWTHVFGPNATNQFVYAGSYYRAIFTQADPGLFPYDVTSAGAFSLNSVCGSCDNFPQGRLVTQYQFVDDFSWTKGNHSIKVGGNFRRYDISDYAFETLVNPQVGVTDQADFFTGLAGFTNQNFPTTTREPVSIWGLGLYAQDEWRVSKSLKLTLALRGEHNSNPNCHNGCSSLLNSSFEAQAAAGNLSGATPYNQLISTGQEAYKGVDSVNLAPRFGFAWSPGGSDKTVVRGGFGIFYDAFTAILADDFFTNAPGVVPIFYSPSGCGSLNGSCVPWGDTTTAASPYVIGATSAAQIKSGFANGASYNSLVAGNPLFSAPGFTSEVGTLHTPRYQEYSFGIQQALGDKASISIGYVGNHGINIPVNNPYANAFGAPGFPAAATSPAFANFNQVYSGGVSNYNGLTASYNQRLTYGFSIQANYTWSHALDDVSNAGSTAVFNAGTSPSVAFQINPNCLSCNNYSNADYDIRNYFSASYVWQTPWKFSNKFVNGAIGGWTLSQNFFARSGLPLTVFDGFSSVGNADAFIYGNLTVPNVLVPGQQTGCSNPLTTCLNANNFATAGGGTTFGNEVRNSYRGPHFFDSDFSVNKNFKLTERMAFGVGANMYNVFNHPNFDLPVNVFGSSAFGSIVSAALPPTGPYGSFFANLPSARVIQFQGKLVF